MKTTTVYLIHLDQPFKHAQHYLGSTSNLEARLADHLAGNGSNFLKHVAAAGITWRVVRTWPGDKTFEAKLRARHDRRLLCPECRGQRLAQRKITAAARRKRNAQAATHHVQ